MTSTYKPRRGSVPSQVIGWLQMHRAQRINIDGIVELCQLGGGAAVHTLMALAMDAGVVIRTRDDEGEYWYGAGPAIGDMPIAGSGGLAARKRLAVKVDALQICDDPVPETQGTRHGAMWPTFEKLKAGQCIKCAPQETQSVAHALVRWLRVHKPARLAGCVVRSMKRYPKDGQGRVWLLPQKAPARGVAK